jgi:hypothetical protein
MEFCKFKSNFVALSVIENALLPNSFEVSVTFAVNDPDARMQNVAFQRIKHLLNNELNCTVITQKNSPMVKTLAKFQNKVVVLPDDGPDWMLSCALAVKLNAICEGRFSILEVEVSSSLGDNISYFADWERKDMLIDILNEMPAADRWWNSPEICFNRFQKFNTWRSLGLEWVLTDNKGSANIERVIQFKPKVLKGGSSNKQPN